MPSRPIAVLHDAWPSSCMEITISHPSLSHPSICLCYTLHTVPPIVVQHERMAIMEVAISSSLSHPNIVQVSDNHRASIYQLRPICASDLYITCT